MLSASNGRRNACFKCHALKGSGGEVREGDWACPSCHVNNYGSRHECFRCKCPRIQHGRGGGYGMADPGRAWGGGGHGAPNPGYGAGTGGRGAPPGAAQGGRPGDWPCPSCGVNCYATRTECFRCKTPKPAAADPAAAAQWPHQTGAAQWGPPAGVGATAGGGGGGYGGGGQWGAGYGGGASQWGGGGGGYGAGYDASYGGLPVRPLPARCKITRSPLYMYMEYLTGGFCVRA